MCIQRKEVFYVLEWLRIGVEMPQLSPFIYELFVPQNVTYQFIVDEAYRFYYFLPFEMSVENKVANIQQHVQRFINQRFF